MDRNYDVIKFYFKIGRVRNFVHTIKIATVFIHATFKNSNKFKIIENYVLKCNLYLYFFIH